MSEIIDVVEQGVNVNLVELREATTKFSETFPWRWTKDGLEIKLRNQQSQELFLSDEGTKKILAFADTAVALFPDLLSCAEALKALVDLKNKKESDPELHDRMKDELWEKAREAVSKFERYSK